ncbi:FGGY-family carbohydrate kinase [Candidatus Poriferisodalis sp.]|uniref:FGGY-family carbohydrate kinase n=1 Tax=Candidatus Poriferisodalis sp. TaxID=3101277 RepID=UPI003C705B51
MPAENIAELRIDGGAAVNDLLCSVQADQLGVPVSRPVVTETTALGAAMLAGLAEGVWTSPDEAASLWRLDQRFEPSVDRAAPDRLHALWRQALGRSLRWSPGEESS